ncbi:MAG: hypothetical protein R2849_17320 [Thermomicrobiales bacterium]
MSGLIGKLKGMFTPSVADSVSDAIEEHVTSERVDDVLNKVPGGDKVRGHVPEDVGQQIGGAVRGFAGPDDETPKPDNS